MARLRKYEILLKSFSLGDILVETYNTRSFNDGDFSAVFFFRKAIWLLHELTYGGLAQMGPSSLGERRTGSFSEQRLVIESSRKFKKKILHRGHHVRFCHPTLSAIQENYKLATAYVFYGQKGSFEA